MNKIVTITRTSGNKEATYGVLQVKQHNKILFECVTLEKAWLDNENRISCIPLGIYNVVRTYSNRFKKTLYLVENVPGRAGIRIHPANFAKQLHGCIALGEKLADINGDGILDVTSSVKTQKKFDEIMELMPFKLEIVNSMNN